jgi:hypothetical protein
MVSIDEALDRFKTLSDGLSNKLQAFLNPFAAVLPDARFRESLRQFVPGMLAAGSPHITKAAAHAPGGGDAENLAERIYTLLDSARYGHEDWLRCLYADARQVVAEATPERLLVALDPVNFEKPYADAIEGISKVRKSTPPGSLAHGQEARVTKGYPAVIAQVVNVKQLAIPFAHLFSYTTETFLSENKELMRAMRTVRSVLREKTVCLLADAGLDDQKLFRYADLCNLEFIIRTANKRLSQVYNASVDRWEDVELQDLATTAAGSVGFESVFTHAGTFIPVRVTLDWFRIRLPDQPGDRWIVVARTQKQSPRHNAAARWLDAYADPLVLITNRPVHVAEDAIQVYQDWHQRPGIEHLYRFIQEDGLDVEKIQLHALERFRCEFVLILAAAVFVLRLPHVWAPAVVTWVRQLASAIAGTDRDRGGIYLFLHGLRRIFSARSLLDRCIANPPPTDCLPNPAPAPT